MAREFLWRRDSTQFNGAEQGLVPLSESLIGEFTTVERVILTGSMQANSVSDSVNDTFNYLHAVEMTFGTSTEPPPDPDRIAPTGTDLDDREFLWLKAHTFHRTNDGNVSQTIAPFSGNFDIDTGTRRRVPADQTAQVWFQFDQSVTPSGTGWRTNLNWAVLLSFETA